MRYGVFGGTFDPPHNGHLALARAAGQQLGLDRVLWVVTADPPHKHGRLIAPVSDRFDMVAAAIDGQPEYEISRVDMDRPGPHWAADTVALLSQSHPGAELVYLMGSDSLRDLPTWGRPREILSHASLGVLRRPGIEVATSALEAPLPGISNKVAFVSAPPVKVSSRQIRQRVARGEPIDGLVPPAVARIILERGLYRHPAQ
jgi:nicotinate-nucleotide adenylyltransferase